MISKAYEMDGIFLQLLLNGLATGMIYSVVALSITVIFKATTIVNFGNGDFVTVGVFAIVALVRAGMPVLAAIAVAAAAMFLFGAAVHRVLLQRIMSGPHLAISMVLIAVGFILRGLTRIQWGQTPLSVPRLYPQTLIDIGPAVVTSDEIAATIVVVVVVALLSSFFGLTGSGRAVRAMFQTSRGAELVGINVPRYRMMMWGAGGVLSLCAGLLLGSTNLLTPDSGAWTLLRGFAAMTLGGFGSIHGAIVGGVLLGVLEKLLGFYVSSSFVDITAFIVTIVVLIVMPSGLFGRPAYTRV